MEPTYSADSRIADKFHNSISSLAFRIPCLRTFWDTSGARISRTAFQGDILCANTSKQHRVAKQVAKYGITPLARNDGWPKRHILADNWPNQFADVQMVERQVLESHFTEDNWPNLFAEIRWPNSVIKRQFTELSLKFTVSHIRFH